MHQKVLEDRTGIFGSDIDTFIEVAFDKADSSGPLNVPLQFLYSMNGQTTTYTTSTYGYFDLIADLGGFLVVLILLGKVIMKFVYKILGSSNLERVILG